MEEMEIFFTTCKIMLAICFIVLMVVTIDQISPVLKEFLFPPCSKCRYYKAADGVKDPMCEKVVDSIDGHPLHCCAVRGSHKCFFEAKNK